KKHEAVLGTMAGAPGIGQTMIAISSHHAARTTTPIRTEIAPAMALTFSGHTGHSAGRKGRACCCMVGQSSLQENWQEQCREVCRGTSGRLLMERSLLPITTCCRACEYWSLTTITSCSMPLVKVWHASALM